MEVSIANTTSAPRNHVITIIKTQTRRSNGKYAKLRAGFVRVFIIAFTREYNTLGEGLKRILRQNRHLPHNSGEIGIYEAKPPTT